MVVSSCRDLGLPANIVNANGGAIGLDPLLGGTRFCLLHTLARELRRRELRRGIASLCGAGGYRPAVLIEHDR